MSSSPIDDLRAEDDGFVIQTILDLFTTKKGDFFLERHNDLSDEFSGPVKGFVPVWELFEFGVPIFEDMILEQNGLEILEPLICDAYGEDLQQIDFQQRRIKRENARQ